MNKSLKFKIEGMTCAACVNVIEDNARKLTGVESVQINFATEIAELSVNEKFDLEIFHAFMKSLGYRAIDPSAKENLQEESFFNKHFYKALFAIILSLITMFFTMGPGTRLFSHQKNNWIQAVLTSIVVFSFGLPYVKAVFKSNMNSLIGIGALSAYIYSVYLLLFESHAHAYFEGTSFIIAFALLGHFFDDKAKTKARSTLSSLYKMQIKFASKIIEGKEVSTPVIELKIDDVIRLRPGEKFPLDGEIITGETHVDESMITGESQAVAKTLGAKVFAGSLNMEGTVAVKVKTSLHDTFISQIVSFVEKAQLKKAPIQQYADKIVKYFVPIIFVLALVTFGIWYFITKNIFMSLTHMIAVLVIACPCALGLAVPMVIMLATTKAAQNGLLVSGGDVLEKGSHIDAVVFDKTGTLTEGQPVLTSIVLFNFGNDISKDEYNDENYFLQIAASCSQYSAHPLSQSLFNSSIKRDLSLEDPDKFQSETGMGVVANYQGKDVLLGNLNLLLKYKIENNIPEKFYQEHVGSYVFMAIDKRLVAAFVITDPVKSEAISLVKKLQAMNLQVWMLTGDHHLIAQKIGGELGIAKEFIRAEVIPSDKASFIEGLQKKNIKVAMIGDGINDAPALSKADLSIAMGNGTDVAIEASEVSVLEGKVFLIAEFFNLSKRTMRVIKENLLLSSVYNLLCIPLAAGVFYPWYKISLTPMWASLAMGLSSFSVIINSFRVRK